MPEKKRPSDSPKKRPRDINEERPVPKTAPRKKKKKKPLSKGRRILKRVLEVLLGFFIVLFLVGGIYGFVRIRPLYTKAKEQVYDIIANMNTGSFRRQTNTSVYDKNGELIGKFPRAAEPGVADELDARCWALVTRLVAIRDAAASASRDGADSSSAPHPDERLRAFSASLVSRCLKSIDFAAEARNLGYSRSVFYRRFTALVGEPPEKHLANLRLDAAARLLRESPLSIKQVAFAIHDKSPSHFAAAFKARFGVTPRAWRDGAMARDAQDSI